MEEEQACSICLDKRTINAWNNVSYECGHWNCEPCYTLLKNDQCPLCRKTIVQKSRKDVTHRSIPCLSCGKEEPESTVIYKCGCSSCLECHDFHTRDRVGKCFRCQDPLRLLWIQGQCTVYAISLSGTTTTLRVNLTRTTVEHMENMMKYITGEFHSLMLVYNGKQMRYYEILREVGLSEYSSFKVITCMRGD